MNIQFLEENHKKKFVILPYRDFVKLVTRATEEEDYQEALRVLSNKSDETIDYVSDKVLENPLRKMRDKIGMTQLEFAKRMKVDPSHVSRLERPGARLSDKTLGKAAKALKCTIDDLT